MANSQSKGKKWLFRILKVLGVLVVFVLILSLIAPGSYKVERSKEMTASPEAIFAQIADFESWQAWSPWAEKDSTLKSKYSGEPGTVGHSTSWEGDSDLSGKGSMTVTDIKENEYIKYELKFENPSMSSNGAIELTKTENGTNVKWSDQGSIPFIMRSMTLFMDFDEMMGPDFERGLVKLDSLANIKQDEMDNQYTIQTIDYPGGKFYGIRKELAFSEVDSTLYGTVYSILGGFIGEEKIEMAGMPVSFAFEWNEATETAVLMPAFSVLENSIVPTGEIEAYTQPACKALVIDYYGAYEESGPAHAQMEAYLQKNGLKCSVVMEEFVTDPGTVESMDEVLTRIYYFLE